MTIEVAAFDKNGEIPGTRKPLAEGEFYRTRRLADIFDDLNALKGIGLRVLSANSIEYITTDSEGNPRSLTLTDDQINKSFFYNPSNLISFAHEVVSYRPDSAMVVTDKPEHPLQRRKAHHSDSVVGLDAVHMDEAEFNRDWTQKRIASMGTRISEELEKRDHQRQAITERFSRPLTETVRNEKELILTMLALNVLAIADQIVDEKGLSRERIMDQTFIYEFRPAMHSLTSVTLYDILSGDYYSDTIRFYFDQITELRSPSYSRDADKLPNEIIHIFLQRLGFLPQGKTIQHEDLSFREDADGFRFIKRELTLSHPTMPLVANLELKRMEQGQPLFTDFSIEYTGNSQPTRTS